MSDDGRVFMKEMHREGITWNARVKYGIGGCRIEAARLWPTPSIPISYTASSLLESLVHAKAGRYLEDRCLHPVRCFEEEQALKVAMLSVSEGESRALVL